MAQQPTTQEAHPARQPGAVLMNNGNAAGRQVTQVPLGTISRSESPVKNQPLTPAATGTHALEKFIDVPVTISFEVGRTHISISQLMELNRGSMIDLGPLSVDVISIRVNDNVIACGEVIALSQRYGVRFGELRLLDSYEDGNDAV